jgi:hypothetical protein
MKRTLTTFVLLLAAHGLRAAPVVLYQTGWEAAPANPAWAQGNVAPQNGWQNFNSAAGHTVVGNGTAGATVAGQAVVTPYGSQFHRFTASASTVDTFDRLSWVDLEPAFTNRPTGFNQLTGSIDLFVPGVQSADQSLYGLAGFDITDLAFGIVVLPSTRSVLLISDNNLVGQVDGVFSYDSWFNLSISADYDTGNLLASLNGAPLAGLSGLSTIVLGGGFTDLDLFAENGLDNLATRSIFSDNYLVTVVPEPSSFLLGGCGLAAIFWARRRLRR